MCGCFDYAYAFSLRGNLYLDNRSKGRFTNNKPSCIMSEFEDTLQLAAGSFTFEFALKRFSCREQM
jgi:hypothetical protein